MQTISLQQKIHQINEQLVILHFDIADILRVEARKVIEVVKKNSARFPLDFAFRVSRRDFQSLKNQNKIPNGYDGRSLPVAFTELGIAMLSGFFYRKGQPEKFITVSRAFLQAHESLSYKQCLLTLKKTVFRHDRMVQKLFRIIRLFQASHSHLVLNEQEIVSSLKQLRHEFL